MLLTQCFSPYVLCEQYLNRLYRYTPSRVLSQDKHPITETYGELLYRSFATLLSAVPFSNQDIFFDLGSGLGKIVLHAFLQTEVKAACGIEIQPMLHQQALAIAHQVRHELPAFFINERKLTFLLGDFLDKPFLDVTGFSHATIVFLASPCFSPSMLNSLGELIDQQPSIHSVLSLRPLLTLKRLPFKKTIRVECSWDTALCYIYSNKRLT